MTIKKANLNEVDINDVGNVIADSFMKEKGSFPLSFTFDECVLYFEEIVEKLYQQGFFYVIDDDKGYISFVHSKYLCDIKNINHKNLSRRSLKKLSDNMLGWEGIKNCLVGGEYIEIFLLAIKPKYQGTGLLRKVMKYMFKIADALNIPCLLETDSDLKSIKYIQCGMNKVYEKELKSGIHMYILIYYPNAINDLI